jgi:peptidoglycan/xylan/chitin deacetylase (PgdA/CDA1 family)
MVRNMSTRTPIQGLEDTHNHFYAPTPHPKFYEPETVISNFQSGHGWTKFSAAGTQTDDATIFIRGSKSMKQTTDGLGSTIQSRKSISSTDMTGKQFIIWFYIENIANLSSIRFRASSDIFTNYYDWQIAKNSTIITDAGTWLVARLSFGHASSTGSPNRAAITNLAVLCSDNNASVAINVYWGGISTVAEPSTGVVTFRFDDGWATQYTNGKPVLDTYNYKASYFIIPDLVGTASYMTLAQLQALYNTGSDICAHHQTDLSTMSVSLVDSTLKSIKRYLLTNNFNRGCDYIAYPNGGFNETIAPIIRRYFRAGTLVTTNCYESPKPKDYYRLQCMNITSSVSPSKITTAIARANTNKEWLILMFHKIVSSGASGNTEYNKADLQTVVDYCSTNNITVKTMHEVLNGA